MDLGVHLERRDIGMDLPSAAQDAIGDIPDAGLEGQKRPRNAARARISAARKSATFCADWFGQPESVGE